jgi:UDP-glucose 4-epimerase
MKILLTGGLGYIGSHTAIALIEAGNDVVIYDNLSNSTLDKLANFEKILGEKPKVKLGDIRDIANLTKILKDEKIDSVIHFAGLKAVGESSIYPIEYYSNNVYGALCVVQAMEAAGLKKIVFSSSATVYGNPKYLPIDEMHPTEPINPYGRNKLQVEQLLNDIANSDPSWSILCLRYFNPVGAHDSGLIGEDPKGLPNNLMPYMAQVAVGILPALNIYGDDYETPDGTGIRDYIHVMDLAFGHVSALRYINQNNGIEFCNLGTGRGFSVKEMIRVLEEVSSKKINFNIVQRRNGDISICYASVSKAKQLLNWSASKNLDDMCRSLWIWQKNNLAKH